MIDVVFVGARGPRREQLCHYLAQQGLRVSALEDIEPLGAQLARLRPELVILDADGPGADGPEICRRLRGEGEARGLILIGERSDEMERVLALELGADDALSRPFSPRELLARVRAVLRRSRRAPRGEPKPLRVGEWLFEPATRCLRRGACVQMLGAVEFLLLSELTSHPGVALSREHLLEVSHPQRRPASARAVDSAIVRLRKLIEPEPRRPRCLRTVRGAGYAFEPRADDAASARSADFTAPALECVAASRARASECAASARRP